MFRVSSLFSHPKYKIDISSLTRPSDSVPEFISQRRRWLNGAFFAAVYSLVQCRQIWQTDHTIPRKLLLCVETVYQFVQLLFTYFSLANFFLTFYFVAGGLADPRVDPFGHGIGKIFFIILKFVCILLIAAQFILSLGNRPQGAHKLYLASMIICGVIMVYTSFTIIYIVIHQLTSDENEDGFTIGNNVFTNLIVSVTSTIGLYIVMSLLYLEPWHLITSSAQYFLLLPSYICTLQTYAFCNTHDVTWGTKGDNVMKTDLGGAVGKGQTVELEMPSEQLDIDSGYDEALRNLRDRVEVPVPPMSESQMQEDYYKSVRTYMVLVWVIANGLLAMGVTEAYGHTGIGENFYLRFILWSVAGLALFRAIGSTTFAIINVVNIIVEGRVRMSLKVPKWMGGFGDKISETVSSVGSSLTSR
jgi:chitin synthase